MSKIFLTFLRLNYKPTDISIKNTLFQRRALKKILEKNVRNFLLAQKEDAQSRLKSAERPKGTLKQYRELLEEANRDKQTLDQLQNYTTRRDKHIQNYFQQPLFLDNLCIRTYSSTHDVVSS